LFKELHRVVQKFAPGESEIICVNDGSNDRSLEVLRCLAKGQTAVKVISFVRNFGQTAALSAGIRQAQGEIIALMDADLQNDPADISMLLAKLDEGYDVVSGWRKDRHDAFFTRKIPSWIANSIISTISGVNLHDYGCTLKVYRRNVIENVNLYGEMHRFIPIYARQFGARITEVKVNHRARRYGYSKYSLSRTGRVVLDLVTVKFLNDYTTRPMHFFGGAGFFAFFVAALCLMLAVVLKMIGYASLIQTPLPLLVVFFSFVGFQLILMGLLAEMLMRNYYEVNGRLTYVVKETINL
jgi:dolichol-phosphate mannosyltransferase